MFKAILITSMIIALVVTILPLAYGQTTRAPGGDIVITPNNNTNTTFVDDSGLTIGEVPPGWTIIDTDNSGPYEQGNTTTMIPTFRVQKGITPSGATLVAILCTSRYNDYKQWRII